MGPALSAVAFALLASTSAVLAAPPASACETGSPCDDAAPSERDPRCEAAQPPIGYGRLPLPDGEVAGTGLHLRACEGEHWDGQDERNRGFADDPATPPGCTGHEIDPHRAAARLALHHCDDPAEAPRGPLAPMGLRLSLDSHATAAHAGACAWPVACVALAGEGCAAPAGGCRGARAGDAMAAAYVQDQTPGNAIFTLVHALRLTAGYVADGDCTQEEYEASHRPIGVGCGRDNSAVTVEALA